MSIEARWNRASLTRKALIAAPAGVLALAFGYLIGAVAMTAIGVVAWRMELRKG